MMNARNKEKLFYKLGLTEYVFHFSWRMKELAGCQLDHKATWIRTMSGVYIERWIVCQIDIIQGGRG